MEMKSSPYLSMVVVGRNDDYGVNFMSRINTFVQNLDRQIAQHPGLLELVIVEWNPLADRARINEVLPHTTNLQMRVITVDNQTHQNLGASIPVLEWYGKNVGVRRARGDYVLVTNPDIIFSDELLAMIAQRPFRPDVFYRADRFDFRGEGMDLISPGDYQEFALEHVFQGHLSDDQAHRISPRTLISDLPKSRNDRMHTNASGDFILAHKPVFDKINGLYENVQHLYHCDSMSVIRLCYNRVAQCVITAPMCIFHWDHPRGARTSWDPALAHRLGQSRGEPNWGLADAVLDEWSNTQT